MHMAGSTGLLQTDGYAGFEKFIWSRAREAWPDHRGWPLNGSAPITCWALADKPSNRLRRSTERNLAQALRPKLCLLARRGPLQAVVAEKLRQQWSPVKASGWLKLALPHDITRQVSHESIYKTLFIQARGALKTELLANVRSRRLKHRHEPGTPTHSDETL
jgi:hypothetical protein